MSHFDKEAQIKLCLGDPTRSAEVLCKMRLRPKNRRLVKTHMQATRECIDRYFNVLNDVAEVAYYEFWKKGEALAVFEFDLLPTEQENKEQYDCLCAMIEKVYTAVRDSINRSLPDNVKLDPDKYDTVFDEQGVAKTTRTRIAKHWIRNNAMTQKINPIISALPSELTTEWFL